MTKYIEKYIEAGRKDYDRTQENLSRRAQQTDAEIEAECGELAEMFGGDNSPESLRESARRMQDQMDRQGREAYAREYAKKMEEQNRVGR